MCDDIIITVLLSAYSGCGDGLMIPSIIVPIFYMDLVKAD